MNPVADVGHVFVGVPSPLFPQSNGGFVLSLLSLTLPSGVPAGAGAPAVSMKLEAGVAEAFNNPTTSASNARPRMTPNRVGWRAISVMLFDNSVTSFCYRGERIRRRLRSVMNASYSFRLTSFFLASSHPRFSFVNLLQDGYNKNRTGVRLLCQSLRPAFAGAPGRSLAYELEREKKR